MRFELSEPLQKYGATVREWSAAEVRPYARQADTDHAVPGNWPEILDTCPVPIGRIDKPESGPKPDFDDGDWIRELVLMESLNYGDTWVANVMGAGIGHLVVELLGTPEQVERWYRPIVEGGGQTAFGLTEPHFGSDTSQVATTATRDGDTWVLNGTKMYCSLGAIADYTVVFATTDRSQGPSAIRGFVVPRGTPGFDVAKANEDKMGIRSAITSEIVLRDCVIPVDHLLGWDGEQTAGPSGRSGALGALARNKPNISAMGVGLGAAALDITEARLAEVRDGFTTTRRELVESELVRMRAALDRARRVNYQAQWLLDHGRPNKTEASVSKAYAPPTIERIIRRCMQLLGPVGTTHQLLLEKWYRDVKIFDIYEGSAQVQRIIVGRHVLGRAGR